MEIRLKRVYEAPEETDGLRILVDRLWPRGLRKEDAALHRWARELSPSDGLRKEFHNNPARWEEFKARYFEELDALPGAVRQLREEVGKGTVTLLYASKETERNNAVALAEYLRK